MVVANNENNYARFVCIDGVKCDDYDEVSRYGFRDLIASPGGPCVSIAQVRDHVESIGCIQRCWSKFFIIFLSLSSCYGFSYNQSGLSFWQFGCQLLIITMSHHHGHRHVIFGLLSIKTIMTKMIKSWFNIWSFDQNQFIVLFSPTSLLLEDCRSF